MDGRDRIAKHFTWPVRVYYEDTDAGGVVYHSQYLNYMERARTEWLRSLGFAQSYMREQFSVVFVVRKMQLHFHRPAHFDDELRVVTCLSNRSGASLKFVQQIFRDDEMLINTEVEIVCVEVEKFKPARIPPTMQTQLESIPLVNQTKNME